MGHVRRLQEQDIPFLVELHERILGIEHGKSRDSLNQHFIRIFLQHPWVQTAMPSLVYQEDNGAISGCIGVMPRPMLFNNKTITAAISHNFLVDPDRRHSMAGIQLASRFLSGPQDFSLAEGNDISRRIWERFDGTVSLLYSLAWLRPIQPSRYLLSYLVRRGLPRAVTLLLRPLCSLGDKLLSRFLDKNAQPDTDNLEKSELEPAQLQECLLEMLESRKIRPLGDQSALAWQLAALNQSSGESQLFKILVRDTNDEPIGWYLYFFRPGGVSDVLQIGARPGLENQVLDHLFNHAKNHGVIALSGQLDPTLFTELSRKQCLFRNDGHSWMLFHTRHPDISQALQQGDAFISRMDGEWWINALNA